MLVPVRIHILPLMVVLLLARCGDGSAPPEAGRRVLTGPVIQANRAYSGAPPVTPHAVRSLGRGDCLSCHEFGDARDGEELAPRTPHPGLTRCEQCHLEQTTTTHFRPSEARRGFYSPGHRQQPLGPWLIPHPLTMREDCLACHGGRTAHPKLKTSHPERTRCLQCHLPVNPAWPGPRAGVTPEGGRADLASGAL